MSLYEGNVLGMQFSKEFDTPAEAKAWLKAKLKRYVFALRIDGVKGVNDIKAHYVGVLLEAEVHIEVDRTLTIYRAHTIGKKVQSRLEKLEEVNRAFVHIDPVS